MTVCYTIALLILLAFLGCASYIVLNGGELTSMKLTETLIQQEGKRFGMNIPEKKSGAGSDESEDEEAFRRKF